MILSGKSTDHQSNYKKVIMDCDCLGCDGKLVAVWWDAEDNENFFISFSFNKIGFRRRVLNALKYVFTSEDLFTGDMCITRKDTKKFIKNLKECTK